MLNRLYLTFAPFAWFFSLVFANVQFLGGTIAVGGFGCQINGACDPASAQSLSDGEARLNQATKIDGVNLLGIPISWQFLVNGQLGSDLDPSNISQYDKLIQSCIDAGVYCMINIQNFARWDGQIIGQGGPTDEQFAGLWGQLARRYATHDKIIFGLMNEARDLNVSTWARTCQRAVTAIRSAGATSQMILLPGINFDNAATLISSGSADALLGITNPDGGVENLVLGIHNVLDQANSSAHAACTAENAGSLTLVVKYLRSKGRKALISEIWASSDPSCMATFCAQTLFANANSDVFTGLVTGGTSSHNVSYTGDSTGSSQNGQLVDDAFPSQCLAPQSKSPGNSSAIPMRQPTPTTMPKIRGSMRLEPVIVAPTSLVVTDMVIQSTESTLDIATGTPHPVNALPTLASGKPSPALIPEASGSNGAGSVVVATFTLWICVVIAVAALVQL